MIEFLEEPHIYLVDGVIVPSVSEILHFIFPDKYKGVNKAILNRKAQYGTTIHESIEMYEANIKTMTMEEAFNVTVQAKELNYIQEASLRQYVKLKNRYKIIVLEQEMMIKYKRYYAGRFDMVANVDGEVSLCDIKTTAELDKEYLSWQLSYYELATGKTFDKLFAIWLPKKDIGRLVEIERKPKEVLISKLNEFMEVMENEKR
ncbi:MAG: PD-(D/E)XK nuclease family protein [Bacilli bacterium]|nr:PD-(D/E)XK nuclease family protein [Bacilli bacterium]